MTNELFTKAIRDSQGPRETFVVNQGHPGEAVKIATGAETSNKLRATNAAKGTATPTRVRYTYEVPRKSMSEIRNADGVNDLIDQYPVAAMNAFTMAFVDQILRGASSSGAAAAEFTDLDGLPTFNGLRTYDPEDTGAENGIFLFKGKSTQTEVIHGLESEGGAGTPITGWYNQFVQIGNSTQLDIALRALQNRAAQLGSSLKKASMGFADELTYQNLITQHANHVRIPMVKGDIIDDKFLERGGIPYHNGLTIYQDVGMEPSDATSWGALANQGVLYLVCPEDWEVVGYSHNGKQTAKDLFGFNALGQIPRTDLMEYEIMMHLCIYTKNRRNQGVLVGGAEGAIALAS